MDIGANFVPQELDSYRKIDKSKCGPLAHAKSLNIFHDFPELRKKCTPLVADKCLGRRKVDRFNHQCCKVVRHIKKGNSPANMVSYS